MAELQRCRILWRTCPHSACCGSTQQFTISSNTILILYYCLLYYNCCCTIYTVVFVRRRTFRRSSPNARLLRQHETQRAWPAVIVAKAACALRPARQKLGSGIPQAVQKNRSRNQESSFPAARGMYLVTSCCLEISLAVSRGHVL